MHDTGDYSIAGIAALFGISRPTVYRSLERTTALPRSPPTPGPLPTSPGTTSLGTRTAGDHAPGPGGATADGTS